MTSTTLISLTLHYFLQPCFSSIGNVAFSIFTYTIFFVAAGDGLTWIKPELKGIPPHPRSLHTAEIMNNRLFIFGGWKISKSDDIIQQEEKFEVSNDLACLNLGKARSSAQV